MAYGAKEVATPGSSSGIMPSNHVLPSKTEGLFCDVTSTALSLVSQSRELERLMKVKCSQKRPDKKMLFYFMRVHMAKKYKLEIIQGTYLTNRQW